MSVLSEDRLEKLSGGKSERIIEYRAIILNRNYHVYLP